MFFLWSLSQPRVKIIRDEIKKISFNKKKGRTAKNPCLKTKMLNDAASKCRRCRQNHCPARTVCQIWDFWLSWNWIFGLYISFGTRVGGSKQGVSHIVMLQQFSMSSWIPSSVGNWTATPDFFSFLRFRTEMNRSSLFRGFFVYL